MMSGNALTSVVRVYFGLVMQLLVLLLSLAFTATTVATGKCLAMSSLYQQRIRLLATEMYKLYYKQGPTYLHRLITRKGYRATTV